MAFLLPALPLFAYFGLLVFGLLVLAGAFWPRVLPRLIAFLSHLQAAAEARRRQRSARLARRLSR